MNPEIKTYRYTISTDAPQIIDFGICDNRGRALGTIVYNAVFEHVEIANPTHCYYTHVMPGTYFAFRVHSTRNGKPFGAWQKDRLFTTEAERAAAIAKYIAAAKKAAAEKAV